MCLDKFDDFLLNIVLRKFLENEQVRRFKTLSKQPHCKRYASGRIAQCNLN